MGENIHRTFEDLLALAKVEIKRNDTDKAISLLERAILLNNQRPEPFQLLGEVFVKLGELHKAIEYFERTLNLNPTNTEVAISLSSLLNDIGHYREAQAVYEKTKIRFDHLPYNEDPTINQDLAEHHYALGLLYLRYERFEEAEYQFKTSLRLFPSHTASAMALSKCLMQTNQKQEALSLLERWIQLCPRDIELRIQRGLIYFSDKDLSAAHREWTEAARISPGNKKVLMYLKMVEEQLTPSWSAQKLEPRSRHHEGDSLI